MANMFQNVPFITEGFVSLTGTQTQQRKWEGFGELAELHYVVKAAGNLEALCNKSTFFLINNL